MPLWVLCVRWELPAFADDQGLNEGREGICGARFAPNLLLSMDALQALKAAEMKITEDTFLVRFGDVNWFKLTTPP